MSNAGSKPDWEKILRVATEVTAVASIFAFTASCLLNAFVFSRWNQDFLQLATPSDVVMSGIRMLGSLLLPIIVALATTGIAVFYLSKFDDLESFISNIPSSRPRLKGVARAIELAIMLLFFGTWTAMLVYVQLGYYSLPGVLDISIAVFLLTIGFVGVVGYIFQPGSRPESGWVVHMMVLIYCSSSLGLGGMLSFRLAVGSRRRSVRYWFPFAAIKCLEGRR